VHATACAPARAAAGRDTRSLSSLSGTLRLQKGGGGGWCMMAGGGRDGQGIVQCEGIFRLMCRRTADAAEETRLGKKPQKRRSHWRGAVGRAAAVT
jgi:hypothetical protein